MNSTDRELAEMVAAYRQVRRPPKHLRLQVARGVSRAQHQVVRRWLAGMGVGGAAAAAALFVVHLVAVQTLSARPDPAASPNEAVYEHRESEGESAAVPPARPAEPRNVPAAETETKASPAATAPSASQAPPSRSRPAKPAGTPSTTLAPNSREIRLLRQAEVALASDPTKAQTLLKTHRTEFPATILGQERDALEILAQCAVSPTDEARRRRDAFAKRHPGSAYAARVRAACP